MATIAKGSITLVNVNDAYSVLFTPDSCAIKADFDGTNPDLTNAYTDITVVRGEEKHTFKLTLASFSNTAITYQQTAVDAYTKRIRLTSIPSDVLSGALTFTITTDDEFVADVTFTYSVIRETSMLDWILDWENNKTVIGDTYLITPKIFVGKKVENEEGLKTLTGVYIGPDDTNTAGIYGYKEGKDVFHINAKGAMIGGWNVDAEGITTLNKYGTLQILSSGTIGFDTIEGEKIWRIWQNGEAEFAKGNVVFYLNGDAYFKGEIQAAKGQIGGWTIGEEVLYNDHIALNSKKHIIGTSGASIFDVSDIKATVQQFGGVYMFYDNVNSYGLQGYLPRKSAGSLYVIQNSFSLGSINKIANWNFDADSLYMGTKVNMQKKYTAAAGDITIGSNGMRGLGWYIDQDGSVSFASGKVRFTESTGSIVGWSLNERRLSNPNMALVSDTANAGIYMSVADGTDFDNLASSSLTDYIGSKGGIYMKIKTDGVSFAAYDSNGRKIFKLRSNGVSSIADWNIENDALFVGEKKLTAGSFTDAAGSMTFGNTGIRGYKWRLEADGSGAVAGGNIQWDKNGEVQFSDSVSLNWTNGIDQANTAASIAQKIAFGQMVARDPEFTLGKWNGTHLYPWRYDSHVEIAASTGNLLNVIKQYGLYAYGNGALVRTINIIGSDGTVSSSYSPGVVLNSGQKTLVMPAKDSVTATDTIQIVFECNGDLLGVVTDMTVKDNVTSFVSTKDLYGNGATVTNDQVPAKRQLVSDTAAPNSAQKVMEISCNRWHEYGDWRTCGFYIANQSRANGEFIVKIVAKIPKGWYIDNSHNPYGNGGKTTWITSQLGTGSYEEYMCVVKCGSTGTFSTINHFALKHDDTDKQKINTNGNSASDLTIWIDDADTQQTTRVTEVAWRIAYTTVYDATSSDKVTTTIDSHGIYTGTLRADQIVAGTIKSSLINADELLSNGNAWALKQDGSGYLASGNISWKTDGSLTMAGEINATSGKIGRFDINYNSLGLDSYDNSGYNNNGMYLSDSMICFNSGRRQAILGCWNDMGLPVICRMSDATDDYTTKVGLAIGITGSTDMNTAIEMDGGWLSGLNYRVQSEGFDAITAQAANTAVPTEMSVTLSRHIVCLYVSTQFYWRSYANRNDSSKFETKARDVNVTLPDMKHYDNGHVLMIKRGVDNSKDVYLIPGKSYQKHLNANGSSYETEGKTCFLIDGSTYVTDKLIVDSEGDAMQLIYFRDLSVTINNVKYNGIWVQWKNPRTW